MNSINIMGRLARDPEIRDVNGTVVAKFVLAWSEKVKGEEKAYFFKAEAWGRTGELVRDYFKKGKGIAVTGKLLLDEWETRDGQKRTDPLIRVSEISFPLTSREDTVQPDPEPAAKPRKIKRKPPVDPWAENARKNNEALDAQTFEPINTDDGDLPF